jgi:peptidoglycan/LPS O-acetylase OafA/YrhL
MLLNDTQKPYIQQVDYIRAVASLAVALFHMGGKTLPGLKYGWLGVYLFFLLSGFIICWAIPKNYSLNLSGKFVSKRIIRIEPPYIISIGLVLLYNYLFNINYTPDWLNVLHHIAYINNFTGKPYLSPVYWTLGIEFQFYLFVALCFPLIVSRWGASWSVLLSALPLVVSFPGSTLAGFFPVFAMGILYYLYFTKQLNLIAVALYILPVALCSFLILGWMPTCAALLALLILILPVKSNATVRFFSKISFSLYLTHDVIGSNLVVFIGQHLPKTFIYKGVAFGCGILVSIAFAYLFYIAIESTFLRISKQIAYTKSTSV